MATKREPLLPTYHSNRDFFTADLLDFSLKSDQASMEAPFFSLATKPDMSIYKWESKDGSRSLQIIPSVLGRATQMDKDILIFLISQILEGENMGREDIDNRRVRFTVYNYLVSTNKKTNGREYDRLKVTLNRLQGTVINTNIKTNGVSLKEGFGLIDKWKIIENSPTDERMVAVEVTLSEWLFNAVQAHEVLKLNDQYFRLRKPLERRIYELARKHCGNQPNWAISMNLLREKSGSTATLRKFRQMVKEIEKNSLDFPDYRMVIDEEKDQVIFWSRNQAKVIEALVKGDRKKMYKTL